MANSIQEKQDQIIEQFSLLENRDDVYEYIIEIGKKLPDLSEEYKTDQNLIKGCQSKVWLTGKLDDEQNLIFKEIVMH